MKRNIILLFTLALAASLMVGAVSAEGMLDFLNENTKVTNDDNTFVVGFSGEFPPFGYKNDNGQYVGFDLDLAKEVAKRNNWTFKAQPIISWDTKDVDLNSGSVDCIWSEFTIDGRENNYTWSKPYFNNSQVVIVRSDSNITSLDDLKGKVVETEISSSALDAINNNQTLKDSIAKINVLNDFNSIFMDLESGVCDAVIVDYGCAKYHFAQKYQNGTFNIIDQPLQYEKYGVAFKKGNDGLKNQVQKTLDEMFKDGTVDKIAQNYSDCDIPQGLIRP